MSLERSSGPLRARYSLFLEPLDVLAFRDHRPSDAGAASHLQAAFPNNSAVLGALRTALVERLGGSFLRDDFALSGAASRLVGQRREPAGFSLLGPFLGVKGASGLVPLLPPPSDVALEPLADGEVKVIRLKPWMPPTGHAQPSPDPGSGKPASPSARLRRWSFSSPSPGSFQEALPWTDSSLPKPDGSRLLLSPAGVRKLLDGTSSPLRAGDTCPQTSIYVEEPRVGTARSRATLTVEEAMFYTRTTWRFARNAGLVAEVAAEGADRDTDSPATCLERLHGVTIRLGGKGHLARVHVYRGPLFEDDLFPSLEASGPVRLWLLQPLRLKAALRKVLEGGAARALERPALLGGWDLANNAPKPLERALPAGTVIWLDAPDWPTLLPLLSTSQTPLAAASHRPATLAGVWKPS